jgi:hypothetical protein
MSRNTLALSHTGSLTLLQCSHCAAAVQGSSRNTWSSRGWAKRAATVHLCTRLPSVAAHCHTLAQHIAAHCHALPCAGRAAGEGKGVAS